MDDVLPPRAPKPDRHERSARAQDPECPAEELAAAAHDRSWRVRAAVALNPATPADLVATLAADLHASVRAGVAGRPEVDPTVLLQLASDPEQRIREMVAEHAVRTQDGAVAEVLVAHGHQDLRGLAARSPSLGPDEVRQLATCPDPEVLAGIAGRPDLSPLLARRLSRASDVRVRGAVAVNPALPSTLRWRMALRLRRHRIVLRGLASNPATTPGLLRLLARGRHWDVCAAVARHPSTPVATLSHLSRAWRWAIQVEVARSPHSSSRTLARLAGNRHPAVRLAVAGNPGAGTEVVDALLAGDDEFVRGEAAGNPGASPAALARVADGLQAPAWVLRRTATNPTCPPELAEEILTWLALGGATGTPTFDPVTCDEHPGDPSVPLWQWFRNVAAELEHPELHALWAVRASAIGFGQEASVPTLVRMAVDARAEVRSRAAQLPATPRRFLRELLWDEDGRVRMMAAWAIGRRGEVRARRPAPQRRGRWAWIVVPLVVNAVIHLGIGGGDDADFTPTTISPEVQAMLDDLQEPDTFPTLTTVARAGTVETAAVDLAPVNDTAPLPGGGTATLGFDPVRGQFAVRLDAGNGGVDLIQLRLWHTGIAEPTVVPENEQVRPGKHRMLYLEDGLPLRAEVEVYGIGALNSTVITLEGVA